MPAVNSGQFSSVSGVYIGGNGLLDASFFAAGATVDAYTSDGSNDLAFGFYATTIVIINESANDLCYAWPCIYAGGKDSGVIKANSTVVLLTMNKKGIKLRSRGAGAPANYLVSAT